MFERNALLTFALAVTIAGPATTAPLLGQSAPAFKAVDASGKTRSLAEFRGKTVVLEWTNNGCPYVQKHYNAGAMQKLQSQATRDGVAWLTIVSSAPGMQGFLTPSAARAWKTAAGAASSDVLLDVKGTVGRAYDARTTPHMFIIDKVGTLVYMGGIDDQPTPDPESFKVARNYVTAALADIKAGRPVTQAATRPYGCSVKYGSAE